MLIAARQSFLTTKTQPPVPMPYDAEIEYIQSDKHQYINTGYIPTATSWIQAIIQYTVGTGQAQQNGVNINNDQQWIFSLQDANNVTFYQNKTIYKPRSDGNQLQKTTYLIDSIGRMAWCGSGSVSAGSGLASTRSFFLFARNYLNSPQLYCAERLFSFTVKEENQLVMDLIPVRKDGTGYLYDKVSGELFGNQGTGNFILGPDK